MKKMLVVYYSWSCGNTERIAKKLSATTGADIERIETVKPYTGSYDNVVNQGQQEVNSGYCPEIKPLKADLSKYDVIALVHRHGGIQWLRQCSLSSKTQALKAKR